MRCQGKLGGTYPSPVGTVSPRRELHLIKRIKLSYATQGPGGAPRGKLELSAVANLPRPRRTFILRSIIPLQLRRISLEKTQHQSRERKKKVIFFPSSSCSFGFYLESMGNILLGCPGQGSGKNKTRGSLETNPQGTKTF